MRWFAEVYGAIKARCIDDERMQVWFDESYLTVNASVWALYLDLDDRNVSRKLKTFKRVLSKTFEPPRAEFRTISELLKTG